MVANFLAGSVRDLKSKVIPPPLFSRQRRGDCYAWGSSPLKKPPTAPAAKPASPDAIEEFSELANRQFIHLGLTSRDLTENVEQLQIIRSLKVVHHKMVVALLALARHAEAHRDVMITARTHNVPAQPTTLGKRFAMFGQELLVAFGRLEDMLARYPVRGLKGAVGTQLDQLTLLGGKADKVASLE